MGPPDGDGEEEEKAFLGGDPSVHSGTAISTARRKETGRLFFPYSRAVIVLVILAISTCLLMGSYMYLKVNRREEISLSSSSSSSSSSVDLEAAGETTEVVVAREKYTNTTKNLVKWVCPLPEDDKLKNDPIQRVPIIVFAEPRTGSNLFFDFLQNLNKVVPQNELDLLGLCEIYTKDKDGKGSHVLEIASAMNEVCNFSFRVNHTESLWDDLHNSTHGAKKLEKRLQRMSGKDDWLVLETMIETFNHRYKSPVQLLQYIHRIPSYSKRAYFGVKIFYFHIVDYFSKTPSQFVNALLGGEDQVGSEGKYIILWRRRVIEAFVSEQIAKQTGGWVQRKTNKNDTVVVDKDQLEAFIQAKMTYYTSIRDNLVQHDVDFEVFEYHRDLEDSSRHLSTVRRIQDILQVPGANAAEAVVQDGNYMQKQAQVSLSELVENWKEVVEWGYGGEVDDWEEVFPGR